MFNDLDILISETLDIKRLVKTEPPLITQNQGAFNNSENAINFKSIAANVNNVAIGVSKKGPKRISNLNESRSGSKIIMKIKNQLNWRIN